LEKSNRIGSDANFLGATLEVLCQMLAFKVWENSPNMQKAFNFSTKWTLKDQGN
jgi:hypothetical protein